MPNLSEDEIDDILYFARANEVDELTVTFTSLAEQYKCEKREIFSAAVDAESKNTALHYAGANGHVGAYETLLFSRSTSTFGWHGSSDGLDSASKYQHGCINFGGHVQNGASTVDMRTPVLELRCFRSSFRLALRQWVDLQMRLLQSLLHLTSHCLFTCKRHVDMPTLALSLFSRTICQV